MMKLILLSVLLACGFLKVSGGGDKLVGPGKWFVINIMKCEEDNMMPFKVEVNRRKINRTHDGFNAVLKLDKTVDDSYAIRVDICKFVDGGCKPFNVLADDSFERFVKKYAAGNVERVLTLAKLDPPDFPLPAGTHEVKSFLMNYDELPTDGQYGEFMCKAFILKDGLEKGCVNVHVQFTEEEE